MWLPRSLCKDTLLSLQRYYKVSLYELSIVSLSLLGVRVLVIEAVRNLLQKPSSVVIPEAKSLNLVGSSSILVFQHLHEHRCGDQHFCSAQTAAAPRQQQHPWKNLGQKGRECLVALIPTLSPWQAQLFPCSCGNSEPSFTPSHSNPFPNTSVLGEAWERTPGRGEVRDAGLHLMGTQVKSRLGNVCAEGLGSLVI